MATHSNRLEETIRMSGHTMGLSYEIKVNKKKLRYFSISNLDTVPIDFYIPPTRNFYPNSFMCFIEKCVNNRIQ